ncbi:MAG: hypothetical protein COA95_01735 [Methylophaga sp.]|nr:MAG: hypothetical protein COA95_01735 [Methylophaga sp.]
MYKHSGLIELFIAASMARIAANLIDVNKSTTSYYFQWLDQIIYGHRKPPVVPKNMLLQI